MRRLIAAINMTVDGFCDHTLIVPDVEIHRHYADLLDHSEAVLYGRVTYQLMEYWQTVLEQPTGVVSTDAFAKAIDRISKIVFSHTLESVGWATARLADRDLTEEVLALKSQNGGDILVCSPSLIAALARLDFIDEYQLCIHPVVAGSGLPLFKSISDAIAFRLVGIKTFDFGAVILYYQPAGRENRPSD